jgi:hypothetical protein
MHSFQRDARGITTSTDAPIFKAPSNAPHKTCAPTGSTGRPNTRHSLEESRATHSETRAHAAQNVSGD